MVQGYLMPKTPCGSQSLHIRRTLDQFFFHDLPDIGKGSEDDDVDYQTVRRYAKRNKWQQKYSWLTSFGFGQSTKVFFSSDPFEPVIKISHQQRQ
jgi:hypothetical protein